MSECYTIEDLAVFTGLTDRTLRSRLLERVNREEGRVRFAYSYCTNRQGQGVARIFLAGPSAVVQGLLTEE